MRKAGRSVFQRNQKADGGRVEGKPHIQPAAEAAESQALRDVEAMIREVSGG